MIIIRIIIPLITREPLQFRTQETFVMVHDSCRDETLGVQPLLPNHNNSAKISTFLIIKPVAVHLPSHGGCKIGRILNGFRSEDKISYTEEHAFVF